MIYYRIYLSFCIAKYIKIDSSIIKTQLHTSAVHSSFVRALLAYSVSRISSKEQKGTERYRKVGKILIDTSMRMSGNVKVSYNINNIKHNISWDIKNIIFKWRGIIFGGFVRDSIISEHYSQVFWENNGYNTNHFWNEQFDNKTSARTLIPKDIDVCIYNEPDINNMMAEIASLLISVFGADNVKQERKTAVRNNSDFKSYIDKPFGTLHTFIYTITVGKIPYFSEGSIFDIMFDIVSTNKRHLKPPFLKLDFLCNGFIMTGHNEISLSNCTGTQIDKLKLVEKKEIESKIIKDLINFKTDYCMKFIGIADSNMYASIWYNEQACKRIEKMCNKKYAWTIENMPIIIEHPKKQISNGITARSEAGAAGGRNCCICQDSIKNKERFVTFPTFDSNCKMIPGLPIHTNCFFKYMSSQIQDKRKDYENNLYGSETNMVYEDCRTFLRCPMRNTINFHVDNIKSVVDKYLYPNSPPSHQQYTA